MFENTDQFLKIQPKYRPIFDIFLKRSVLQTKIIFTNLCVITAMTKCQCSLRRRTENSTFKGPEQGADFSNQSMAEINAIKES